MTNLADYGIQNRAMLVRLKLPSAQSKRKSKVLTAETAVAHDADEDMLSTVIDIMPKAFLKDFNNIRGLIDAEHTRLTLPWNDGGMRIQVLELYDRHREFMQTHIPILDEKAEWLVQNLPAAKEASKLRLKSAFDESIYPTEAALRHRLRTKLNYYPLPSVTDFRIGLDADSIDYLKSSLESDLREKVEEATRSVRDRMLKVVESFVERLEKVKNYHDVNGKPRVDGFVRSSVVTNITSLLEVIPGLNIAQDPDIDLYANELRRKLCMYEASTLNESEPLRKAVLTQARDLLSRLRK